MKLRDALAEYAPDLLREWERRRAERGTAPDASAETVARFRSRTYPATSYRVSRGRGGALSCDCPGYQYRRRCAHTRAAATLYGPSRDTRRPANARPGATVGHGSGAGRPR